MVEHSFLQKKYTAFFASILLRFRPLIPAECMAKEHKYEGNFFPT